MKSLIKGGICMALGWLATSAGAQEAIQWQSSTSRDASNIAVVSPQGSAVRPVSLSQPVRLDAPAAENPIGSFRPIIRMQAPDEKTITIGPSIGNKDGAPKVEPKALPKDTGGFSGPPPTPFSVMPLPNQTWSQSNIISDGPIGGDCGMGDCGGGAVFGSLFGGNGCCPDRARYWIGAEYLMWWQRAQQVPPLVTTSPAATPRIESGVLGAPGTTVVYDSTPNRTRGGARFTAGAWLPRYCNLGLEVNYFFLGRQDDTASFGSAGDPQYARPYTEVIKGPSSELVAIDKRTGTDPNPVVLSGTVAVNNYSQVWGAEANLRKKWLCGSNYWLDILGGYRHLNLSEGITITENLQNYDPTTLVPGTSFIVRDSFTTRNQFNGAQIGLDGEFRLWNRMFIGATTKIAFGTTYQIVNIDGSTTSIVPGAGTFVAPGGLLATTTNNGRYTAHRFAVLPEVTLKVGVDITDNLRLFVGYDFLYLSNVVRPGEQIDTVVNDTAAFGQVGVGAQRPAVLFRTNDYWVQGLTFGLQYRW